ncbi:hypothetical protein AB1Y20_017875 [Prymnesium parvum]|uniref:Calmodulin-lysine N-methyltransferase n=1 Tax=Prymnesium parvum TaxID=97485 RepID=A0AB34JPP6_PRYPA
MASDCPQVIATSDAPHGEATSDPSLPSGTPERNGRAERTIGLHPASYEASAQDYVLPCLLGDYEDATFRFETADGAACEQTVRGWTQGGCRFVWSTVLPHVVAANLSRLADRLVLELGAGCGLVGLLAAHAARRVLLTDGDLAEVALCEENAAQHAPKGAQVEARHLAWGAGPAREFQRQTGLQNVDVILASQVVYVPACIPALVETFAEMLAPSGEIWLYNDRVSYSLGPMGQATCRALLDAALLKHNFVATDIVGTDFHLPHDFGSLPSWAYLLRITRAG